MGRGAERHLDLDPLCLLVLEILVPTVVPVSQPESWDEWSHCFLLPLRFAQCGQ